VNGKSYLTLNEVMKKYGKTYTQVRYATETGRLTGVKMGWTWFYPEETLPQEWPEPPRNMRVRRGK
jgi:hypothetical protein